MCMPVGHCISSQTLELEWNPCPHSLLHVALCARLGFGGPASYTMPPTALIFWSTESNEQSNADTANNLEPTVCVIPGWSSNTAFLLTFQNTLWICCDTPGHLGAHRWEPWISSTSSILCSLCFSLKKKEKRNFKEFFPNFFLFEDLLIDQSLY
jgi:hypothetical protein